MYAYSAKEHNWVGYDDPKTLSTKLDYVKSKGTFLSILSLYVQ